MKARAGHGSLPHPQRWPPRCLGHTTCRSFRNLVWAQSGRNCRLVGRRRDLTRNALRVRRTVIDLNGRLAYDTPQDPALAAYGAVDVFHRGRPGGLPRPAIPGATSPRPLRSPTRLPVAAARPDWCWTGMLCAARRAIRAAFPPGGSASRAANSPAVPRPSTPSRQLVRLGRAAYEGDQRVHGPCQRHDDDDEHLRSLVRADRSAAMVKLDSAGSSRTALSNVVQPWSRDYIVECRDVSIHLPSAHNNRRIVPDAVPIMVKGRPSLAARSLRCPLWMIGT